MTKHDVPVLNRPFSQVAEEYANMQQRRANAGEVSQDRWSEYPLWRREKGVGRRNGITSDSTIRIEMTILAAIMNYATSKQYVPAHHQFKGMPKLKSA
jgi:integrase